MNRRTAGGNPPSYQLRFEWVQPKAVPFVGWFSADGLPQALGGGLKAARECGCIVTAEEHQVTGGMGGAGVTGLGEYDGALSEAQLTDAVRTGVVRFLLQVVDVLGKQDRAELRLAKVGCRPMRAAPEQF